MTVLAQEWRAEFTTVERTSVRPIPLWLTLIRVPISVALVGAILADATSLGVAMALLFFAFDFVDGAWSRAAGEADSALRRGLDSIIDRLAIVAAFAAATIQVPQFLWVAVAAAALSLLVLPLAIANYVTNGVVVRCPKRHRAWSGTLLLSGGLFLLGMTDLAVPLAAAGLMLMSIATIELLGYQTRLWQGRPLNQHGE